MKFLDDILRRKSRALEVASTTAPVERDELEDLQTEIEMHRAQLAGLEDGAREAGNKLGEIAHLASALKVRISEHDSNAVAGLDALEREELMIRRTHDGLVLRIQAMQQEIAPKVARASELAIARDAVRQDEVLKDLATRTDAMVAEIIGHWHEACRVGFDLMEMLDGSMSGSRVPLDEEHRRQVLVLNTSVGKKMLAATLSHVNERFVFARPEAFHNLKIVPARRRDEPQPAPVAGVPRTEDVAVSRTLPRSIAG
jgi:hypothetical protein